MSQQPKSRKVKCWERDIVCYEKPQNGVVMRSCPHIGWMTMQITMTVPVSLFAEAARVTITPLKRAATHKENK